MPTTLEEYLAIPMEERAPVNRALGFFGRGGGMGHVGDIGSGNLFDQLWRYRPPTQRVLSPEATLAAQVNGTLPDLLQAVEVAQPLRGGGLGSLAPQDVAQQTATANANGQTYVNNFLNWLNTGHWG
jgi:hypothetical protein